MIRKVGSDNSNLQNRLMQADKKQEYRTKIEKKSVDARELNLQQDTVLSKQIQA